MPTTPVREHILNHIHTLLNNVTHSLGDITVTRNFDLPIDETIALAMFDGGQQTEYDDSVQERIYLDVFIEMHIENDEPSALLNELYAAVVVALLADQTVGGYASLIEEGDMSDPSFETARDNTAAMQISLTFTIQYSRDHHNPYI